MSDDEQRQLEAYQWHQYQEYQRELENRQAAYEYDCYLAQMEYEQFYYSDDTDVPWENYIDISELPAFEDDYIPF